MTLLVLLSAMHIQLILAIESNTTEGTERMPLESALIDSSRIVISFPHMFRQLGISEQVVLMRKHFLMPRA